MPEVRLSGPARDKLRHAMGPAPHLLAVPELRLPLVGQRSAERKRRRGAAGHAGAIAGRRDDLSPDVLPQVQFGRHEGHEHATARPLPQVPQLRRDFQERGEDEVDMMRLLRFLGTTVLIILFTPVVILTGCGTRAPSYAPNLMFCPDGTPNPNYDPSHVKPAPPPPPPPPLHAGFQPVRPDDVVDVPPEKLPRPSGESSMRST